MCSQSVHAKTVLATGKGRVSARLGREGEKTRAVPAA